MKSKSDPYKRKYEIKIRSIQTKIRNQNPTHTNEITKSKSHSHDATYSLHCTFNVGKDKTPYDVEYNYSLHCTFNVII